MKEEEIRPKDTLKMITEKHNLDIKKFFMNDSNELDIDRMVYIDCPACGETKATIEFKKESFSFFRCDCNTLFVNPRPKKEVLAKFYSEAESISLFMSEVLEKTAEIRKEKIFLPRVNMFLNLLDRYCDNREMIIEIGGGNGLFLEKLKEKSGNFKKHLNIEPSTQACKLCVNRGIDVYEGVFEEFSGYEAEADVIVAFELIEHLFSPKEFILKAYSHLRPNGLLYLTTPNILGFDLLLLGRLSDNINAPNHLNYFNIFSLSILLNACGFDVIEVQTPGQLDVNILENKYKEKIGLNIDKFTEFILNAKDNIKKKFQEFLSDNNLSSNMTMLARKRN